MKGKEYSPKQIENKCYNCESKNITSKKSESWTSKWKCNDCKKENFAIYADWMGGALNETVFVSDEEQF